jgi:hypothetical protein
LRPGVSDATVWCVESNAQELRNQSASRYCAEVSIAIHVHAWMPMLDV